jgi:30S ribosomal protein S31
VYNRRTSIERENAMGKGDQRTRRGKLFRGSYGKTRPGRPKKKQPPKKP